MLTDWSTIITKTPKKHIQDILLKTKQSFNFNHKRTQSSDFHEISTASLCGHQRNFGETDFGQTAWIRRNHHNPYHSQEQLIRQSFVVISFIRIMLYYLTHSDGDTEHFCELYTKGDDVQIRCGETGSDGVSSIENFKSFAEANAYVTQILTDKMKNGYTSNG